MSQTSGAIEEQIIMKAPLLTAMVCVAAPSIVPESGVMVMLLAPADPLESFTVICFPTSPAGRVTSDAAAIVAVSTRANVLKVSVIVVGPARQYSEL